MAAQLGFYIDSSSCVGCKTCEISCKDKNSLSVGPRPRYVREIHGGSWVADENDPTLMRPEGVFSYNVSVSCNHCANPACVANCPTGAMQKNEENGVVWSDPEVCIKCGTCAQVCPYGAPQVDEAADNIIKCDLCQDLLANGEPPACVEACPMRALEVGEYEELVAKYGDVRDVVPLPDSSETLPSIVIKLHADAAKGANGYSVTLYPTEA